MLIIYAVVALGLIALVFGFLLSIVARSFAVATDPRIEAVIEALPGANCGACGYAGCANFAEAVVAGEADNCGCIPGGQDTAAEIAEILGQTVCLAERPVATVFCIGNTFQSVNRYIYDGVKDCAVASGFVGGFKACSYGCLGLGTCVEACLFDAIKMGEHGLPVVDVEKCTGCGLCAAACPRSIIKMLPQGETGHLVLCNSLDRGRAVSAVCKVGCIACKACVKACPEEAITMIDNLAVIDLEKCTDCGECVPKCKPGTIFQRQAIPTAAEALAVQAAQAAETA